MTPTRWCPRGCGRRSRRVLVVTGGSDPLCVECKRRKRPAVDVALPRRTQDLAAMQAAYDEGRRLLRRL